MTFWEMSKAAAMIGGSSPIPPEPYPTKKFESWQSNSESVTYLTVQASPIASCLLLVCVAYSKAPISIDGDGWETVAVSQEAHTNSVRQKIVVFGKKVQSGLYTINVSQEDSGFMSLKVIAIYGARNIYIVDNALFTEQTYTPTEKNQKRRLYIASSCFYNNGYDYAIGVSTNVLDLQAITNKKFCAFYDYQPEVNETPTFTAQFNWETGVDEESVNFLTLEIND